MEPEPDFEDALKQLEAIVDDLERGEPELSAALAKYEQGVRLLARCHGVLDRAEQSVALLTGVTRPATRSQPLLSETNSAEPEAKPNAQAPETPADPPAGDGDDALIPF